MQEVDGYKYIVLTRIEAERLVSNLVYILYRDDTPVWIGGSTHGFGVFTKGEIKPRLDWNRIQLIFCKPNEVNSLVKKLEDELKPEVPNKNKNSGVRYETLDEIRERRQEEIRDERLRKEFVDKLVDEELPLARWKK